METASASLAVSTEVTVSALRIVLLVKIVSISIDRDRKDWEKALKRLGLPWTQVLADYSFVNSYGINKIPVLMLISPDGIILKRNFGIEDLNRLFQN